MANVVIVNKRNHIVTVGVHDDQNQLVALKLGPHERSEPMDESKVSHYTKRLVSNGHAKLHPHTSV